MVGVGRLVVSVVAISVYGANFRGDVTRRAEL
jgi:hypothetical protein